MKRLSQLDGIRGLAVAAVLMAHLGDLADAGIDKNVVLSAIHRLLKPGWMGVDIFFVLSGFLITGIILKERSQKDFWSNFYLRRAFRILPAFLAVYVVTLVAIHFFSPGIHISTSYLLLATFFMANWTILTNGQLAPLFHIWSLAVEEQFYFLWPQAAKRLNDCTIFKLALAMAGACVCLRIGLSLAHVSPYILYEITPTRIDGICVGSALAAGVKLQHVRRFLSLRWRMIALIAAISLPLLFLALHGDLNPFGIGSQVFAIPAVVILTAMLIYGAVESTLPRPLDRFFANPVMVYLGRRSYGLYLIHDPIRIAVSTSRTSGYLATLPRNAGVNLLLALSILVVSLVLTEFSWRFIESPAQNLRRRLVGAKEDGSAAHPSEESAITELSEEIGSGLKG